MKQIVMLLALALMVGCELNDFEEGRMDVAAPESVATPEEITMWVYENIPYKPDTGEYWQYPDETMERSTGDCEDRSILVLAIAYACGYNKEDLTLYVFDTHGVIYHAVARIGDKYYDPAFVVTDGDTYRCVRRVEWEDIPRYINFHRGE